jgi:hypothetical protein
MKVHLPQSQSEKAEAYLRAMLEIKSRLDLIEEVKDGMWPLSLRIEICYLQLRYICDLVTIGSLIVQGDYSSHLGEAYAPGPIFKMLEKKYEGAFPQPATISNNGTHIAANSVPNAMTKNGLVDLWNKTGDKLHRLKISRFFRSYETQKSGSTDMEEIESYVAKLRNLLATHIVPMHNPKTLVVVTLFGEDGSPNLSFLEYGADGVMTIRPYRAKGATDFFRA